MGGSVRAEGVLAAANVGIGLRGAARGECGENVEGGAARGECGENIEGGAARGECGENIEGGCCARRVWGER